MTDASNTEAQMIRRISVQPDGNAERTSTLVLHLRDDADLEKLMALLPAKLANHPLTMTDRG